MVGLPRAAAPAPLHRPELVLFAVDLDAEGASVEVGQLQRLDVIKAAITTFVRAKKWVCSGHRFGLLTLQARTATLLPASVTSSVDAFLEQLSTLQPAAAAAAAPGGAAEPFDLGSLVTAAAPLADGAASARRLPGGFALQLAGGEPLGAAAAAAAAAAATSSRAHGALCDVRVVLLWCRSRLPAPVLATHTAAGLAVDCLHVHDKPQPGQRQQELQAVYSALESLVDDMAARAGHASLIFEATGRNLSKVLTCMSMLLSHPRQRRPQSETRPPLDLAAAPLQPLPSDLANLASGVPIVPHSRLPAPAPGSAWAKPLSAAALSSGAAQPAAAAAGSTAAGEVGPASHKLVDLGAQEDPWSSTSGSPQGGGAASRPCSAPAARGSAAPSAAGSSPAGATGAGRAAHGAAVGVPVEGVPVQGTPIEDEAVQLAVAGLDEGIVMGFSTDFGRRGSSSGGAAQAAAPGSGGAAAAAAAGSSAAGHAAGTTDEGLEGLAAALMVPAAVEELPRV